MLSAEYRLRWQRVGLNPTARIFQTGRGVLEKAERMLALDENKHCDELTAFSSMPDLVWMRLEARSVGDWAETRVFDVPEADPDSYDVAPQDDMPW